MFSIKQCCRDKMLWIDSQCHSTLHINIPYIFLETCSTHIGFNFSFYRCMGVLCCFVEMPSYEFSFNVCNLS